MRRMRSSRQRVAMWPRRSRDECRLRVFLPLLRCTSPVACAQSRCRPVSWLAMLRGLFPAACTRLLTPIGDNGIPGAGTSPTVARAAAARPIRRHAFPFKPFRATDIWRPCNALSGRREEPRCRCADTSPNVPQRCRARASTCRCREVPRRRSASARAACCHRAMKRSRRRHRRARTAAA